MGKVELTGRLFPFLALSLFWALAAHAQSPLLAPDDARWQALLRFPKPTARSRVEDPKFFLSAERSSSAELQAVRDHYSNPHFYCRFPARFLYVGERESRPALDYSLCPELRAFTERAPIDRLDVVFASENLTQASSMMGHVLLKMSGTNAKGIAVEHALSFYTDLGDGNFAKLVYESLLTGKKGYFALSPYAEVKHDYLFREQRNLWEHELRLSDFDRRLLAFHLYELKEIEFRYFFHAYNCSTFVFDFLSVLDPAMREDRGLWVTPLDVVRSVSGRGLVDGTHAVSSSKWRIRSLEGSVRPDRALRRRVLDPDVVRLEPDATSPERLFLTYELARAVNAYAFESGTLGETAWRRREDGLARAQADLLPDGEIDVSGFKLPSRTAPDSELSFGARFGSGRRSLLVGFLPAAHALRATASEYLGEFELALLSPTLRYDVEARSLRLDSIVVYSMQSFAPSDALLPTLSGKFRLGWENRPSRAADFEGGLFAEGGVGKTYRLLDDIDFYLQLNAGLDQALGGFFAQPETGVFVREVFAMKTQLSYALTWLPHVPRSPLRNLTLRQVLPLRRKVLDLSAELRRVDGDERSATLSSLSLHYAF